MEKQKIILLVEDNEHDELLTIRALKKHQLRHEIIVCRDGAEALDWLFCKGQHAHRDPALVPSVVLLDLKLPKVDGQQVLTQIRSHALYKRLPVVILTTSKEESDLVKSYDNGANSYIQKPVSFDEFSEAIKNLGVYWLSMNEVPRSNSISVRPSPKRGGGLT